MESTMQYIDRKLNGGVVFLIDLFRHLNYIAQEKYELLSRKSKGIRAVERAVKPLLCDLLIIKHEALLRSFLFNMGEKLLKREKLEGFELEYKVANKHTNAALSRTDPDIDINPGDRFIELHIGGEFSLEEVTYQQKIEKIVNYIKQINENEYGGKIKYILGLSDLAVFLQRYGFKYIPVNDYAQNKTMLYNLKHGFIFKNIEILGHSIEKRRGKEDFKKNPQKAINRNSRKDREIGLCYYKL